MEASVVETATRQILRVARDERFAVIAYCVMPDHAHLVMEGVAADSDLRRFVKLAKQRSDCSFRMDHALRGVWQEGYHDWVIRPSQDIIEVIRYVLNNPVRAGLVERWEDYPFSYCMYPLE